MWVYACILIDVMSNSQLFTTADLNYCSTRRNSRHKGTENHCLPITTPLYQRFLDGQEEVCRTDQQFWTKLAQPTPLALNETTSALFKTSQSSHSKIKRSTWTYPTFKLERVAYRMLFIPMQKYWCIRSPLVLFHPYLQTQSLARVGPYHAV